MVVGKGKGGGGKRQGKVKVNAGGWLSSTNDNPSGGGRSKCTFQIWQGTYISLGAGSTS